MNNIITEKTNPRICEKYYQVSHKSGLEIYVIPKKMSTSYALFATKYGSIDNRFRTENEKDFTEVPMGVAHFLEHKMFENEDGIDTFARFAATGANANAYTTFDKTAFLFSCTDNFEQSLKILLDFVSSPYFTPETVQKEQGIIAQEIKMYEDLPSNVLFYNLLGIMYDSHPVKINIAGTVESISEISADLLYRCYNTFYNPSNMALCVCGDIDPNVVVAAADQIIQKRPPVVIERFFPQEPAGVRTAQIEGTADISMPLMMLGLKDTDISKDPVIRQKKGVCVDLILDILFGKTSAFYESLYKEGLINGSLNTDYEHNRNFSFATVSAESKNPQEVFRRIRRHIEKHQALKTLSDDDFIRAKRALYADAVTAFDSTEEIANSFLDFIFDDFDMLNYTDIISAITLEEVNAILHSPMFSKKAMALSVLYPRQSHK